MQSVLNFGFSHIVLKIIFVVWLDTRTAETCDKILENGKRDKNFLKHLCGLPISTYFSAVKLRWLMDNVEKVRNAIAEKRLCFGTVDSWLIWVG